MKNFAIKLAWIACLIVFTIAVLSQTTLVDQLFLTAIVLIPIALMYMVYRVLKEDHRATDNRLYQNFDRRETRQENSTSL